MPASAVAAVGTCPASRREVGVAGVASTTTSASWATSAFVAPAMTRHPVGVRSRRRTIVESSSRAPAIRGPEDPEELARTGRSTLDTSVPERTWTERARHRGGDAADGPATAPDPDDAPGHDPDDTPEEDPR